MLIGLSGYGGSGKDTVGTVLRLTAGYERRAVGDGIRAAAGRLGFDPVDAPRDLLQRIGRDHRDTYGERYWIDAALAGLPDRCVVTDLREVEEALAVVERGGFVVRVTRPDTGPANDHPNEIALDEWPFDWLLVNDGSVAHLAEQVGGMLYRLPYLKR